MRQRSLLVLCLTLLLALFAGSLYVTSAASRSPHLAKVTGFDPEIGTPEQQALVRTSRDSSQLPLQTACTVKTKKELFITDVSVVDDCIRTTWTGTCTGGGSPATRGAWTVGGLLPGIFGTNDPAALSQLTLRWLNQWTSARTVNGDVIPARPNMTTLVINPWLAASGGSQLDMTKAPFRLLAIVSRLDLRQNVNHGGVETAGEARFVFNVLSNNQPTQFNVIFEYGLPAADCNGVLDWAQSFHSLGSLAFGNNYNAALETITDSFTAINAVPTNLNGSAIDQVRTDEIALVLPNSPWELREFHLKAQASGPAALLQVTVAQTPARSLQGSTAIFDFVTANAAAIKANNYTVPLSFEGNPFRGGAITNDLLLGWDGSPSLCATNADAREVFSLNTCNGCHGKEANIVFKQVEPRSAGVEAALSTFLKGGPAFNDLCGVQRTFDDLNRRRVDLCQLLNKTCSQIDAEPQVTFVH
ncbi:MAG TPA: hypothetical protein VGR07_23180 [Thermoanaerobaculia bacterium]|jgi:hypothetical protein|nr:hypothetical protein [Thermoanaerobaculia bacterium]